MRIALVDDDRNDRSQLRAYIRDYFQENGETCEIREFENAAAFLSDYAYTFDLVVMDIDMPGLSGIEAARQLREKDPHVTLMFVTNMPQYALEGYAVEAVDYLLKPLHYPDFRLKMQKARRYIARNADQPLSLPTPDGFFRCNVSDILYVESRLHYLYYHTADSTIKVRGKLSEVEGTLLPYHFARPGESYLVNLRHLRAIEGNEILVGEDRLPLSRRRKTEFVSAFTRFMGGF